MDGPIYVVVQTYSPDELRLPIVSTESFVSRAKAEGYIDDRLAGYREYHAGRPMQASRLVNGKRLFVKYAAGKTLRIRWKLIRMY